MSYCGMFWKVLGVGTKQREMVSNIQSPIDP